MMSVVRDCPCVRVLTDIILVYLGCSPFQCINQHLLSLYRLLA